MSRATHDAECPVCKYKGAVGDEVIICPKCRQPINWGYSTFGELTVRIKTKKADLATQETKLSQG